MPGFGADRLARRLHQETEALTVPDAPQGTPASRVTVPRREFAGLAGVEDPDPWQCAALDSEARRLLWLCSRQAGKSTTAALLADHEAVTVDNALVLLLAPALRQSKELFRKCKEYLRNVMAESSLTIPGVVKDTELTCELENGSRIIALPGSEATTRGFSAATLVVIDEASRVPDELITAVRPTLATTNGRLIALSTPAGKRGWFYQQWVSNEGWERTKVTAHDCPRISKEWLEEERRTLGEWMFNQEYFCEFYDPETAFFSSELIERAFTEDIEPLWSPAA